MKLLKRIMLWPKRVPEPWRTPALILLGSTIYVLWVTRHVWGGIPGGEDVLGHVVRTNFAMHDLFPRFRTDGWLFTYGTGIRPFQTYGPGYAMAISFIRLITFGSVSTVGAVAFFGVACYAAVPWSVAYFSRQLRFPPLACAIAGVLTLTVESHFGGGLKGLYGIGLLPHAFGIPLFFVTLGSLLALWRNPNRRSFSLAVFIISLLLLTHQISILSLIIVLPVLVRYAMATEKVSFERVQWIWLAAISVAGLTMFWLLPAIGSTPEHGAVVTLSRPTFSEFWHRVWIGEAFAGLLVVRLALAAWAFTIWRTIRGKESFGATLPIIATVSLVFASYAVASVFGSSDISLELPNRAFPFIAMFGLMPLGLMSFRLFEYLRQLPNMSVFRFDIAALGLLVTFSLVYTSTKDSRNIRQTYTKPTAAFTAVVNKINSKVPDTGRVLLARGGGEYEAAGVGASPRWMVWKNNHWNLHMFGWETSPAVAASDLADRFAKPGEDLDADLLRRFGVSEVIVFNDKAKSRLDQASQDFAFDFEEKPYRAYRVLPAPGNPEPSGLLQQIPVPGNTIQLAVTNPKAALNRVSLNYTASQNAGVTAAITWSRGWHAEVDGKPVKIRRTTDSVIAMVLPAGNHTLDLTYKLDIFTRIGQIISLFTLLGLIAPSRLYRRFSRGQ